MSIKFSVILGMAVIFASTAANAQFQLSANGSYLKGTGDNTSHLWGGGITGRYLLAHTVSIGLGFNSFPKNASSQTVNGTTFSTENKTSQFFGNLDVMLGGSTSMLQPYIGANIGTSANSHSYTTSTRTTASSFFSNDKTFFYLAPLVGFNIGLDKNFGVFAQGSYGLTFGDSNNSDNNVTFPSSTTKPVDKFLQVDAGVYVRF